MKKLFMTLLLGVGTIVGAFAQSLPMVTLETANGTQLFKGTEAFKEAMAIADHGDVLTLSDGTFQACDIKKAVKIYGKGSALIDKDGSAEGDFTKLPSRIEGDLVIDIDSVDGKPKTGLYIEGVYFKNNIHAIDNLTGAEFVKNRFGDFLFWRADDADRGWLRSEGNNFRQCRFAGGLVPGECLNMVVENCVVRALGRTYSDASLLVKNCVVLVVTRDCDALYKNNFIFQVTGSDNPDRVWGMDMWGCESISPNSSAYNCVFASRNFYNVGNAAYSENCTILAIDESKTLFSENLPGWYYGDRNDDFNYHDSLSYSLTDEAKAKYLGDDGKEIGVYGGEYGYNNTPSVPHIIYKNIDKETKDGKLKVNIKVDVVESTK